jgi:hypothetical protein
MAGYEVWAVSRPEGWNGVGLDDAPPQSGPPLSVLAAADELFAAVRLAMEHNEAARQKSSDPWAIVVERGSPGRIWPGARLCTPLGYRVTAIWWPSGWEPQSPLDVPNCLWRARGETNPTPMSYDQARAAVRGLNQQSMDHASPLWYVLMAVENEPISQTVSYDASGMETTVQVRRMHLIRPEDGGRGDCSYCPAHSFQCNTAAFVPFQRTDSVASSRSLYEDT